MFLWLLTCWLLRYWSMSATTSLTSQNFMASVPPMNTLRIPSAASDSATTSGSSTELPGSSPARETFATTTGLNDSLSTVIERKDGYLHICTEFASL